MRRSAVVAAPVRAPSPASPVAPALSVVFVAGCLACIPWGAPIGGEAIVVLAGLAGAALAAARFDRAGRWSTVSTWPVFAVLGAYAASILRCQLPGLAVERSASMPLFAAAFLAVQVCMWDRRTVHALCWIVVVMVLAMSADIVYQRIAGVSLLRQVPAAQSALSGSQGNRNDMTAAIMLLPIALVVPAGLRGAWLWRCVIVIASSTAWLLSLSRQAFAGWLIGAWSPLYGRRLARRSVLIAIGVIGATACVVAAVPAARARSIETVRAGLGVRERIVALGIELAVEHPVTGIGPGLYGSYYAREALGGWSWRGAPLPQVGMPWAHCLPVEVACEFGVVGLAAFGSVMAVAFRRAWRSARAGEPLGRATFGILLAFGIVGLVDLTFIKDWVRCEWWIALGLAYGRAPSGV